MLNITPSFSHDTRYSAINLLSCPPQVPDKAVGALLYTADGPHGAHVLSYAGDSPPLITHQFFGTHQFETENIASLLELFV